MGNATHTTAPRINLRQETPEISRAVGALDRAERDAGYLDPVIRELINIRVSQVNGCAYCIDMHWKDARATGETEQRLYGLDAWRESPYYSDRERAALEWTEALTNITAPTSGGSHVPDAVFDSVRGHFSEKELADLTWAIAGINAWNRVAIAFRTEAGKYRPAAHT